VKRDYVTIVSGLPRSGTSMMMKMLDEAGLPALTDQIRKADADNPKGYYEFELVKKTRQDPSWLAGATGKCVKMVYRLLYDLPDGYQYRVILMRRNLDEVLQSQEVMLERSGKGGGTLSNDKLKAMFQAEMEKAARWMSERPNFAFIDVNYNQMLAEPRPQVKRLNDFLGGDLSEQKMLEAIDPNLYRQRKS